MTHACTRVRMHACVIVTQVCRHLVATLHHKPEHCKTFHHSLDFTAQPRASKHQIAAWRTIASCRCNQLSWMLGLIFPRWFIHTPGLYDYSPLHMPLGTPVYPQGSMSQCRQQSRCALERCTDLAVGSPPPGTALRSRQASACSCVIESGCRAKAPAVPWPKAS